MLLKLFVIFGRYCLYYEGFAYKGQEHTSPVNSPHSTVNVKKKKYKCFMKKSVQHRDPAVLTLISM